MYNFLKLKRELVKSWDLTINIAISLILVFIILTHLFDTTLLNLLRILIGIPFIFYIPGNSLISTFFIKDERITQTERLFLSIGLSICIIPILGLIIFFPPIVKIGLIEETIVLVIGLISIILASITIYRRLNCIDAYYPSFSTNINMITFFKSQKVKQKQLSILLSALIIISSILLILFTTLPQQWQGFTEFNIHDQSSEYVLNKSEQLDLTIEINNYEHNEINYVLEIWLANNTATENTTLIDFMLENIDITLNSSRNTDNNRSHFSKGFIFKVNISNDIPQIWFGTDESIMNRRNMTSKDSPFVASSFSFKLYFILFNQIPPLVTSLPPEERFLTPKWPLNNSDIWRMPLYLNLNFIRTI